MHKKFWEETTAYISLISHGPHRKRHIQQFFFCCVCIHCHGNSFTETLPSNQAIALQPNHCLAMKYTRELCPAGHITKYKSIIRGPDGAQNQERLCWREPAAICWTGTKNDYADEGQLQFIRPVPTGCG
jgi:hypothetical protein